MTTSLGFSSSSSFCLFPDIEALLVERVTREKKTVAEAAAEEQAPAGRSERGAAETVNVSALDPSLLSLDASESQSGGAEAKPPRWQAVNAAPELL